VHAAMMACVISSILSLLMPSSRAMLAAARAAAISMSSTIGRVSSIVRSAVEVIAPVSSFWLDGRRSKGEEQSDRGLDPLRHAAELIDGQQGEGVGRQDHGQCCGELDGLAAGFGDAFHGVPPHVSGPPLSNATATRTASPFLLLTRLCCAVYTKSTRESL